MIKQSLITHSNFEVLQVKCFDSIEHGTKNIMLL